MFLGWFSKITICLASRFSGIGSATILLSWSPFKNTQSAARVCSILLNPYCHRMEARGSGAVGFLYSLASTWGFGDILIALQMKSCAAQFITWPVILSLSTCLACPVLHLPVTLDSCLYELGNGVPLRSTIFGLPSRMGWGRNIRAVKSDHEASAKASAHLAFIAKPTLVTCRDLACQE
jgi:hypothetical protein